MLNKIIINVFLVSLLISAFGSFAFADDQKLCPVTYYTLPGLDGREGACTDDYTLTTVSGICENCNTTNTLNMCTAYYDALPSGRVFTDSSGEVGVSKYISNDKALVMAGAIQPIYDDGRELACKRNQQIYTVVSRTGQSFPGLTNTMIGIQVPGLCTDSANPTSKCRFSTMYAGPRLPAKPIESLTETEKYNVGINFPETTGQNLLWYALASNNENIQARYMAWIDTGDAATEDIITISQYVYKPDDSPYVDITWKIESLRRSYSDVKFWHVADTYTGGNDYGYGYLCDVSKVVGGTGGSAFFQGTIALHPSAKQFEGWWAKVFHLVKTDELPEFSDWSRPLDPTDPNRVPLTTLDDNAIAHEWDEIDVGPTPQYVSLRWTFDDPILQSTYGTPRSLFAISSDDQGYRANPSQSTITEVEPSLYDIYSNPRSWRGHINSYRMPKPCSSTNDCRENHATERCLETYECRSEPNCPKYCGNNYCTSGGGCAVSGQHCIFGYCIDGKKWETEELSSHNPPVSQRHVFTFDKTGRRYWFSASVATQLNTQFNLPSDDDAKELIKWVLGSLNGGADAQGLIIDDNESTDFDLHNPLKEIGSGASARTVSLLRERYDDDENNRWLLGDISHADPVYVGAHPVNSWRSDVGTTTYKEFYNTTDYKMRQPILLISANDGMLHCYHAETGEELWAFVPWDVLPRLVEMAKPFYEQLRTPAMDLRPIVHDMYDQTTGQWKSFVMVGSRGGGDHYWAFEITAPTMHLYPSSEGSSVSANAQSALKFAWYFADEDLGLSFSLPTSGRFVSGAQVGTAPPPTKWLVFLGSGYGKHSAAQMQKEGYFYVLDMFAKDLVEPQKIKTIAKIRISSDDSSMVGMGSDETFIRNNVLSSATVFDAGKEGSPFDPDGYEDTVYIGDLAGHLIRFTFPNQYGSAINDASDVTGQVVFNTFRSLASGNTEEPLSAYLRGVENKRLESTTTGTTDQYYEFHKYPRPISVRPVVWRTDPVEGVEPFLGSVSNRNKVMVFFGTGKYDAFYDSFDDYKRDPNDNSSPYDHQEMFAVIDYLTIGDGAGQGRVRWGELQSNYVDDSIKVLGGEARTIREVVEGSTPTDCRGWHLTFNSAIEDNKGEKIITEPVIWEQENLFRQTNENTHREWIVFFTTFTPNMQGTCDIRTVDDSGGGFLMTVTAEGGSNPSFAVQDVSGDSLLNSSDLVGGSTEGFAGQKFTGSILSRVDVDPYQQVLYVKTGGDRPVMRIKVAGLPSVQGAKTTFYRIK